MDALNVRFIQHIYTRCHIWYVLTDFYRSKCRPTLRRKTVTASIFIPSRRIPRGFRRHWVGDRRGGSSWWDGEEKRSCCWPSAGTLSLWKGKSGVALFRGNTVFLIFTWIPLVWFLVLADLGGASAETVQKRSSRSPSAATFSLWKCKAGVALYHGTRWCFLILICMRLTCFLECFDGIKLVTGSAGASNPTSQKEVPPWFICI